MNASSSFQTSRLERFYDALVRAFHRYAAWLVSISWKLFLLLSLILLIFTAIIKDLPPFTWRTTEVVTSSTSSQTSSSASDKAERKAEKAQRKADKAMRKSERAAGRTPDEVVDIVISSDGVRVRREPRAAKPDAAASGASSASLAAASAAQAAASAEAAATSAQAAAATAAADAKAAEARASEATSHSDDARVRITIPRNFPGSEHVREAIEDAVRDAMDNEDVSVSLGGDGPRNRRVTTHYGESLPEFAFLWILASALIKFTYKGQMRAEAAAAVATETAEAETLKRQVVEARMAAMQAQVEPHFLFNTLASIDHLIETDPPRASKMQKNLIALLRASMPTMREHTGNGLRPLGQEIAVIQPYLEILKVRMEDRLNTTVEVPEGLRSAAFPPMMLQSLVENAIKHGLEPKAEGGTLQVKAEVVHGRLVVSVIDSGLGMSATPAATAGTGVGLQNIRERLKLVFGDQARLTMAPREPSGTIASITVPYTPLANA